MTEKLPPIHPGETILEDILKPLGMNPHQLALALRVPATRISEIVAGRRAITPDTALRLARYCGTSADFWMNLQTHYDLQTAEDEKAAQIKREVTPRQKTEAAAAPV